MLVPTQAVIVASSGPGGGLARAANNMLALIGEYENARIVTLGVSPISNPLGRGDLGIQLIAVIDHDSPTTPPSQAELESH